MKRIRTRSPISAAGESESANSANSRSSHRCAPSDCWPRSSTCSTCMPIASRVYRHPHRDQPAPPLLLSALSRIPQDRDRTQLRAGGAPALLMHISCEYVRDRLAELAGRWRELPDEKSIYKYGFPREQEDSLILRLIQEGTVPDAEDAIEADHASMVTERAAACARCGPTRNHHTATAEPTDARASRRCTK